MCIRGYSTEFGLANRFIDHLEVVTTNNYYTIAYFLTTDHSTLKCSQSIFSGLYLVTGLLCSVFTRRFLVTNLSDGDSSAFVARWLTLHI
jgi:hypothetical protein